MAQNSSEPEYVPLPESKVPEYHQAGGQFIWELLQSLMTAQDPLLQKIARDPVDHVPSEATRPDGCVGMSATPARVETTFVDKFDTIINMDMDGFAIMMQDATDQSLKEYMPQFFEQMRLMMEHAGQRVDAGGKPFSIDLYLDGLERVQIDFTEDEKPKLPTLVAGPELAEKIAKLVWTDAQLRRYQEMMDSKKREFDARRRIRKLD